MSTIARYASSRKVNMLIDSIKAYLTCFLPSSSFELKLCRNMLHNAMIREYIKEVCTEDACVDFRTVRENSELLTDRLNEYIDLPEGEFGIEPYAIKLHTLLINKKQMLIRGR